MCLAVSGCVAELVFVVSGCPPVPADVSARKGASSCRAACTRLHPQQRCFERDTHPVETPHTTPIRLPVERFDAIEFEVGVEQVAGQPCHGRTSDTATAMAFSDAQIEQWAAYVEVVENARISPIASASARIQNEALSSPARPTRAAWLRVRCGDP